MVIKSKFAVPVPTISIPGFVFQSPNALLSESPLLISAEDPDGFLSLSSYRDWSRRFAAGLKAFGVENGDRIFFASHNTIYNAVVFMGTVMAGAIFVGVQATYSAADIAQQLKQTDPKVVLATESFMPKLVEACRVPSQDRKQLFLFDECLDGDSHWTNLVLSEREAQDFTWESFSCEDAAKKTASLIYSSGSTGFPKGVEMSHGQMIAAIVQSRRILTALPRGGFAHEGASAPLCYMSMSQVVGQTTACINYPSANTPLIIPNNSDFVSVIGYMSRLQITSLLINPSFLVAMNKRPEMRARLKDISSLQLLISIGSPLDYGQYKNFIDQWSKEVGRPLVAVQVYGMTELGGGAIMKSLENEEGTSLLFPNMEAKVVNFDAEEEVHTGTEGELCIRGPNVAKGYWKNPEATEKSFTKDGWLKTGDAARIDESGNLSVLARVQDLIRVDGQIIIPLHIERVLLSHPDVQEAVIYGISRIQDGIFDGKQANEKISRSQNIRAYIVKAKDSDLTVQDVNKFLTQQVPTMRGLSGGVVFLDIIPKTSNHKPNKRLVLEHCPTTHVIENGQPQPQIAPFDVDWIAQIRRLPIFSFYKRRRN